MTYVSVSTGFKGGGTNPRPFVASQVVPFGPETLTTMRSVPRPTGSITRLRFNLAGFYNKYKDIQVVLLSCPQYSGGSTTEPCAAPVNGGDANIYGVEVESRVSYRRACRSRPAAAGSTSSTPPSIRRPASRIGSPEPGFQPTKWSVGAQYDAHIPNGGTDHAAPRFHLFRAGTRPLPSLMRNSYLPGYHELNGRLTYRPESNNWEASVVGSNLSNKLWYTQIFDLSGSIGRGLRHTDAAAHGLGRVQEEVLMRSPSRPRDARGEGRGRLQSLMMTVFNSV